MNPSILDGRTTAQKIAEAIAFLQDNGYVIRGPLVMKKDVRTPAHLVRYFYDTLAKYRPNSVTISTGNSTRDRILAKGLIDARAKTGCGRQRALAESCELIDILFKYEPRLGLSQTVHNMAVLGQGNMSWVTERLLQLREGLDKAVRKEEEAKFFQQLYSQQETNIDSKELKDAKNRMDKVLERYGKKEETD
jgi:hypothetical protein